MRPDTLPIRSEKPLLGGTPTIYRASAAPWDFQPQGSFRQRLPTGSWRSLELHKHHRALGLASTPTGTRSGCRYRQTASGPAGHAAASARRAPCRALLRRELSRPVALCGEGQPFARPARDPVGFGDHALRRRLDRRGPPGPRDAARRDLVLHAPGQGRGSDRRGLFRAWRAHLQPRYAGGAGQDRRGDRDRRPKWQGRGDRPQPARPPSRQLGPCQAQPRGQVRRRSGGREAVADGRPPGLRRARHLLPCRQPGDDPGGLCRSHGARPRRDRRSGGDGRHRRCRRRFPVVLSGHGAAPARAIFRGHPRDLRSASDQLLGRIVVRARPRPVRRICQRPRPRRKAPRR